MSELQFNNQIWVVKSNGIPVGVIEVKKPSGDVLGSLDKFMIACV